jgi:phosphoglycerate kinase
VIKRSVKDLDVSGKRILVRVDFNVPVRDGEVTDDTRIRRALPTIQYLLEGGARLALISHLGRPKGEPDPKFAMDPVAGRLEELLGAQVEKLDTAVGPEVEEALNESNGEGVVLLENSRFYPGETKNDPEFSEQLAAPFDLYVDDAFGAAHRAQATTVGVAELLPAAAGLLMEEEIDNLNKVLRDPERPFVAILGGARSSDKVAVIESLLGGCGHPAHRWRMCFTFMEAQGYEVGKSLVEDDYLEEAEAPHGRGRREARPAGRRGGAEEIEENADATGREGRGDHAGHHGRGHRPETVEKFRGYITEARTIFWNGPMGVFEIDAFAKGTEGVARAVAESEAISIVGGGDSVAAVSKLGLEDEMGFISTGGGASLEYVEGKELPGVAVLPNKEED